MAQSTVNDSEPLRLSKRMSELGLCSRREADEWIAKGWVTVDGKTVSELGVKVLRTQKIGILEEAGKEQKSRVTILLNKPLGYVSGQAEDGHEPAKVLIEAKTHWKEDPSPRRFDPSQLKSLVPAGRLDINSSGLLVLTQDGRVARELIGKAGTADKEYIVRVAQKDGKPNSEFPKEKLALLNFGLELDGKPLQRAKVSWLNEDQLKFVLREGRNRQIRRMCELVGLKVLALKRVRIGAVRLGKLPLGQWRYLGEKERFADSALNAPSLHSPRPESDRPNSRNSSFPGNKSRSGKAGAQRRSTGRKPDHFKD